MDNGKDMRFTLMADSTLLRSGQPFFLPPFAPHFAAVPMLMLRVGRLGKCIAPRFAHRYIDAGTASFIIKPLDNDMKPLSLNGLECVMDGATVFGSWTECDASLPLPTLKWTHNGTEHTVLPQDFVPAVDAVVEHLSKHATLKMGDVVCLGAPGTQHQLLAIDDLLTAAVNDKQILKTKIK